MQEPPKAFPSARQFALSPNLPPDGAAGSVCLARLWKGSDSPRKASAPGDATHGWGRPVTERLGRCGNYVGEGGAGQPRAVGRRTPLWTEAPAPACTRVTGWASSVGGVGAFARPGVVYRGSRRFARFRLVTARTPTLASPRNGACPAYYGGTLGAARTGDATEVPSSELEPSSLIAGMLACWAHLTRRNRNAPLHYRNLVVVDSP